MQGAPLFLPRLHRGAIPFLGMANSVVVVVQVLVVDALECRVLLLLFQAGSFISFHVFHHVSPRCLPLRLLIVLYTARLYSVLAGVFWCA